MNLVDYKDQVLWTPAQKFDFLTPPCDPVQFAQDLVAFMYEKKGIGLAAPQVGMPYRVFAMRGGDQDYVLFNPTIVWLSDEMIELEEGCLSFPGLYIKVKRPRSVRIRFAGPCGEVYTKLFGTSTTEVIQARVIQHEMTHLDGTAFFDGVSRLRLTSAINKAKKTRFHYAFGDLWRLAHPKETHEHASA